MKTYRFQIWILSWLWITAFTTLHAQNFGNEWIDHSRPYYKIKVARTGVYRIPFQTLQNTPGFNTGTISGNTLILYHQGQVVPLYVTTTGLLGANDFIEFFGRRNEGNLDAALFDAPDQQLHTHQSLFTDTAVYYLSWGTTVNPLNYTRITNNLTNLPAREPFCWLEVINVQNSTFNQGQPYYIGNDPVFRAKFENGEGFVSAIFNKTTRNNSISTPFPHSGGVAELRTVIIGTSNTSHRLQLQWNGQSLKDTIFTGYRVLKNQFNLPVSNLNATNDLSVTAAGLDVVDRMAISLIYLRYPSQFNFNNQSSVAFSINNSPGDKYLEITNYNANNNTPILYDLTNFIRVEGIPQVANQRFRLPGYPSGNLREFWLTNPSAPDFFTVNSLERIQFVNFNNTVQQGNFIIISHQSLRNSSDGVDYLQRYQQYRSSLNGGNFNVKVVDIDELYDQFYYGVAKHPMAIRNFIRYMQQSWSIKPEYVLLIGKAREYNAFRYSPAAFAQCLVPTFGNPGSDVSLAANGNGLVPLVPTSRLPVSDPFQLKNYLEKLITFESTQNQIGDPFQTVSNKLWMKKILHLGGGTNASEQNTFKFYLNNYKNRIEDTLYGGHVLSFFKTSSNPIQIAQSDFLRNTINEGVSMITFFGHSSPSSFDIALDNPENYDNTGRYPFILSNGCFTGNIHTAGVGISERFVFTPAKGAIGFMSTIGLSSSTSLNVYTNQFYQALTGSHYHQSLGKIVQETIRKVQASTNNVFNLLIVEEMTLNGDPAIRINTHERPDYAIEVPQVSFIPNIVTVEQDSFEIQVIVSNLGKAIRDSIHLRVIRTLPDGSTIPYVRRIRATYYSDTIKVGIPIGNNTAFGINQFNIKIDADDEVLNELSETNNEINTLINIISEDVYPIHPYEFSIESAPGVTLFASTANVFAGVRRYKMEIDTTELFNSPLKQSTTITQKGGILRWTPTIPYLDSTVYYWRVGLDTTIQGQPGRFNNSSFIYLSNQGPGWNQSHYYQFQKDDYQDIRLNTQRKFEFVGDLRSVTATAATWGSQSGVSSDQLASYLNGSLIHRWVCGGSGFPSGLVISVFDSITGRPMISRLVDVGADPVTGLQINLIHGNIHCRGRDFEAFDFPVSSQVWRDRIVQFLNSIPNGQYIMIHTVNAANYSQWDAALIQTLTNLGSIHIADLTNPLTINNNAPWAFFVKKGDPTTVNEQRGFNIADVVNFSASFEAFWNEGGFTTPVMGPALQWRQLKWKFNSTENPSYDDTRVAVIGIRSNGTETVLAQNITALDTSLQWISASDFPFLRLQFTSRDDSARTPSQLQYWRVIHDKVPEAALHPPGYFSFNKDTLNLGEKLSLKIAVENVSPLPMDSLLVKYTIFNGNNQPVATELRYAPLPALDSLHLDFEFETNCNCLTDLNRLVIDVNPDFDQPEQFRFNNIGVIAFRVVGDKMNPLLDVTFDGQHIVNGDIVSAEPEILIRLKDENKFLALNDTSLVNVFIRYPDKSLRRIAYDQQIMQFFPATGTGSRNNSAEISLRKRFEQDGEYELLIQAQDRSRNVSGFYGNPENGFDYRITFEVINKPMITHVLNYPNPFTSSTRFVFTLTGSQVPTFFKIQIMTVSGRVVREIMKDELGPIRIGRNITDFAWDGTDAYGDPLGNGLYLYRVVASMDGKPLEHLGTSVDKYFRSGFGKMYLVR